MKVLGYSERGLINALLYEVACSPQADELMGGLVSTIRFPNCEPPTSPLRVDTLMIEQSLSDFGDADAILLGAAAGGPVAFFIEAKVKPWHRAEWTLEQELDGFTRPEGGKVNSSNLFAQLYHKARLAEGIGGGGVDALKKGLRFPPWSSKGVRRIGSNGVVLRAVEEIASHVGRWFCAAIVPDSPDNAERFFRDVLPKAAPSDCADWDASRFGYACWQDVERFCRDNGLSRTLEVFDFNRGQVYG